MATKLKSKKSGMTQLTTACYLEHQGFEVGGEKAR